MALPKFKKERVKQSMSTPNGPRAVVLSFPLNPRRLSKKLLADIAEINYIDSAAVYGSNMRLATNSSTQVKLYLPNFSANGFSTAFSVSGDMAEGRLTRLINVYGLAASLKLFDFVHYVAGSHLIICISVSSKLDDTNYVKAIQSLNGLQEFLDVQKPAKQHK